MHRFDDAITHQGPAHRNSGAHVVYSALRARIISLDLPPDRRLREEAVSRQYDVSRTPVREAFRLLMAEGFLEQRPTGGVVVTALNPDEMHDVYTLRATIESLLARHVVERGSAVELAEIGMLGERMSLLADDENELRRLGRELHARIASAAHNRHAVVMLQRIQGQLDRYRALGDHSSYRRPQVLEEHIEICHAIAVGDVDKAEKAVRDHALAGYEAAASLLKAGPRKDSDE